LSFGLAATGLALRFVSGGFHFVIPNLDTVTMSNAPLSTDLDSQ